MSSRTFIPNENCTLMLDRVSPQHQGAAEFGSSRFDVQRLCVGAVPIPPEWPAATRKLVADESSPGELASPQRVRVHSGVEESGLKTGEEFRNAPYVINQMAQSRPACVLAAIRT